MIDRSHPVFRAASMAYEHGFGHRPVFLRSGGFIPIVHALQTVLRLPPVVMGYGLPTDQVHGPNEHLQLGQLWRGIATSRAFMRAMRQISQRPYYESDETIVFRLTSAQNGELGSPVTHVHTILNDDPVTVYWSRSTVITPEGQTRPVLQARLAAPLPFATSIGLEVLPGYSASPGVDFVLTSNRLVFQPGQTVANVPLRVINDVLYEDDETLSLLLTDPQGGIGIGSASQMDVTITNDDAIPTVSFSTTQITVRDQERVLQLATLVLSRPAGKPLNIAVVDFGGSASLWEDYGELSNGGYNTFAPGQTRLPVELQLLDDTPYELPVEVARFRLVSLDETRVGTRDLLSLSLRDNDSFPQVKFTTPSSTWSQSDGFASVIIRMNQQTGIPLQFQLVALPGSTARLGVDYTWELRTVRLAQGESEAFLYVRLLPTGTPVSVKPLRLGLPRSSARWGC